MWGSSGESSIAFLAREGPCGGLRPARDPQPETECLAQAHVGNKVQRPWLNLIFTLPSCDIAKALRDFQTLTPIVVPIYL